jgi:predicted peptidase
MSFMMRRILVYFVLFTGITSMSHAQHELFDKLVFEHAKGKLPYRLLKPVNPGALDKYPLIIFLHGAGERDLVTNPTNRGRYAAYVLAPQCPKGEWWAAHNRDGSMKDEPTQPTQLLLNLLEEIMKDYPIDESRIYITGVSMGGFGTWDLLARFPNKFAAAAPVCGGGDEKTAPAIRHIPIWAFHGAKDSVVSPRESRTMISALQKAGGQPGYTEYPDVAHDSWVQAYQEPHLLPWLFKQQMAGQPAK